MGKQISIITPLTQDYIEFLINVSVVMDASPEYDVVLSGSAKDDVFVHLSFPAFANTKQLIRLVLASPVQGSPLSEYMSGAIVIRDRQDRNVFVGADILACSDKKDKIPLTAMIDKVPEIHPNPTRTIQRYGCYTLPEYVSNPQNMVTIELNLATGLISSADLTAPYRFGVVGGFKSSSDVFTKAEFEDIFNVVDDVECPTTPTDPPTPTEPQPDFKRVYIDATYEKENFPQPYENNVYHVNMAGVDAVYPSADKWMAGLNPDPSHFGPLVAQPRFDLNISGYANRPWYFRAAETFSWPDGIIIQQDSGPAYAERVVPRLGWKPTSVNVPINDLLNPETGYTWEEGNVRSVPTQYLIFPTEPIESVGIISFGSLYKYNYTLVKDLSAGAPAGLYCYRIEIIPGIAGEQAADEKYVYGHRG